MKLSKTTWLVLGIGIFAIAVASLGMAYYQQTHQQSQLNQELSLTQLRLDKYLSQPPSSHKEELEGQLAGTKLELEDVKAILSQPAESIEVTDTLFEVAEICDVEVTEIGSSSPTSRKLENVTYSALALRVRIEGDVPNLMNFILKWTEQYSTGVVTSVKITVPITIEEEGEAEEEEAEEEEAEEEEEKKPSADLTLFIYTYEGD